LADDGRIVQVVLKAEISEALFEVFRCPKRNVRILDFSHDYFHFCCLPFSLFMSCHLWPSGERRRARLGLSLNCSWRGIHLMLLASPVKQELSNLTYDSMAEHIPSAVKQAQSVLPGTSVSDLTNGFTDAFCADVTNRPGLTELQKRYLIDHLAQLIYTQASNGNEGSPKSK